MQSVGHTQQAAEQKQRPAQFFDAGKNNRVALFLKGEAVDAVDPESLAFPDDFPPRVTLGYVQGILMGR